MAVLKLIILILYLLLAIPAKGIPFNFVDPPPKWEPIFAEMGRSEPLKCNFKEARSTRFQKSPKHFYGRLWWDSKIGLCLFYEKPSQLIFNILGDGVRKGTPGKPLKALPTDGHDEILRLFSNLFNWNVTWLTANFHTEGEIKANDEWQLRLKPLKKSMSSRLSDILLEWKSGLLNRIHLDLRGGRKVEIHLYDQVRVKVFSKEEVRLAFPDQYD